jgi:hypothetical protein
MMNNQSSPSAFRLFAAAALLAAAAATSPARDFTVATISPEGAGQARLPAISSTGLVAWQQSPTAPDGFGRTPSDIYSWKDGTVSNRTGDDPRVAGSATRPVVHGDTIAFTAICPASDASGIPFQLSIPPKTDDMAALENDYPSLFGHALPEPPAPAEGEESAPPPPERSPTVDYRDATGMTPDIVLCNPDGTIKRLTPGNHAYSFPVLSDTAAAFLCDRTWPYGYEMVGWKIGAGELVQITTNYFYVQNPSLHGNQLVFQAWDGHDYEIYLHDFETGETTALTQNNFDDMSPVICDGIAAWVAYPTVNAEIFLWENGSITKISTGSTENAEPSIWNGRVVWQGVDDDGDLEIFYYHARRTVKLTSNTWDDIAPQIADGIIAWSSYIDNWDAEAVALDLSDNLLFRLTDNSYEDINVRTAGEKVVWQTITPEGATIQLATPASPREGEIN